MCGNITSGNRFDSCYRLLNHVLAKQSDQNVYQICTTLITLLF